MYFQRGWHDEEEIVVASQSVDQVDPLLVDGAEGVWLNTKSKVVNNKGTGHFFETLSVGSVPGTNHS